MGSKQDAYWDYFVVCSEAIISLLLVGLSSGCGETDALKELDQ